MGHHHSTMRPPPRTTTKKTTTITTPITRSTTHARHSSLSTSAHALQSSTRSPQKTSLRHWTTTTDVTSPPPVYSSTLIAESTTFTSRPTVNSKGEGHTTLIVEIAAPIVFVIVLALGMYIYLKKKFNRSKMRDATFELSCSTPRLTNAIATKNPIPVVNFDLIYDDMSKDSYAKIRHEYMNLANNSRPIPEMDGHNGHSSVTPMDRYVNVLPFTNTAVILTGRSSYINANYISSLGRPKAYIAAQGPISDEEEKMDQQRPKKSTINDFWRMIWQNGSTTIVMLTPLIEKGKVKCARYWPGGIGETIKYSDITVTLNNEANHGFFTERIMTAVHKKEMGVRKITHYYCDKIADFESPKSDDLISFINLVRTVSWKCIAEPIPPIVVHCSAGVGRTGIFIAVDILIHQLSNASTVDVLTCVYTMRTQRCKMVQSQSQYIFIYQCLKEVLRSSACQTNRENIEDGLNQNQNDDTFDTYYDSYEMKELEQNDNCHNGNIAAENQNYAQI